MQSAQTENPTAYIKDKLKSLVQVDRNGVVIPLVDMILKKFKRALEEAHAQAIAA